MKIFREIRLLFDAWDPVEFLFWLRLINFWLRLLCVRTKCLTHTHTYGALSIGFHRVTIKINNAKILVLNFFVGHFFHASFFLKVETFTAAIHLKHLDFINLCVTPNRRSAWNDEGVLIASLLLLLHICLICCLWNTQDSTEYNVCALFFCLFGIVFFFVIYFAYILTLSRIIFTMWVQTRLNQKSNMNNWTTHIYHQNLLRKDSCESKHFENFNAKYVCAFFRLPRLHFFFVWFDLFFISLITRI